MGALCVVIFQLPEVLQVDCELAYLASLMPALRSVR